MLIDGAWVWRAVKTDLPTCITASSLSLALSACLCAASISLVLATRTCPVGTPIERSRMGAHTPVRPRPGQNERTHSVYLCALACEDEWIGLLRRQPRQLFIRRQDNQPPLPPHARATLAATTTSRPAPPERGPAGLSASTCTPCGAPQADGRGSARGVRRMRYR
jgi:hypothetical protein